MSKTLYLTGYYGFGDSIYQYPFVKELSKHYSVIYLRTPFPYLFDEIPNIKFIKPPNTKNLLTCDRAVNRFAHLFDSETIPQTDEQLVFHYQRGHKIGIGMTESFNKIVPTLTDIPINWNIPIKSDWIKEAKQVLTEINTTKKICLLKLPSVRKEWYNISRIGAPKYFQYLIDKLKDEYYFISVADRKSEDFIDKYYSIDKRYENAEITLKGIIALASLSDLIIGYHSSLIAIGIATGTKTFCIFGGYLRPELWIDEERMDMTKIGYVAPEPFCNCNNRRHEDCNKEISLEVIDAEIGRLLTGTPKENQTTPHKYPKRKKNLLISRIRAERCHAIANNPWMKNEFNFFTVDHTNLDVYYQYKGEFKDSFRFPSVVNVCEPVCPPSKEQEIYDFCKKILTHNDIELVINSQPLHPYNTIMAKVCSELGIKAINTEMFCDSKLLLDWKGCQYTKNNEIYDYVNAIPEPNAKTIIDFPLSTRQPQPPAISKETFFKKYNLNPSKKYIVLLGQLMWDMSVKQSVNANTTEYKDYVSLILNGNPEVHFIVKPHPLYIKHNRPDFDFVKKWKNVTIIDESLDTLFSIFDYYTSYSSTTVFEGLMKNKKFATIGFHFCNNDQLVYQLRADWKAKTLYRTLSTLKINPDILKRYLYFVCNYYTVKMESDKLFYRLILPSEEYFKLKY